jgi:single-stranded-DNA-specific exonuclease
VGHEALTRHLDLVALATISDVVPLVDENRALALAGLRGLARTQKPGLQALMKAARVDPARVDEGRGRVPARSAHQRVGSSLPTGRRARAPAHRGQGRRRAGSHISSRS